MLTKQQAKFFVAAAHRSLLGRMPDDKEIEQFATLLSDTDAPADVAEALMGSVAFSERHGIAFSLPADPSLPTDEPRPGPDLVREVRVLCRWLAVIASTVAEPSVQFGSERLATDLHDRLEAVVAEQAATTRRIQVMALEHAAMGKKIDVILSGRAAISSLLEEIAAAQAAMRQDAEELKERLRAVQMDQVAMAHRMLSFEEHLADAVVDLMPPES